MIKNFIFAALMAVGMGGIAQACDACNGTSAAAPHTCAVSQSYQTVSVVSPQTVQYAPTALVAQDACDNHAVSAAVVTTTATPVVVQQPVVVTGNAYVQGTQRVVVSQHVGAVHGYSGNAFVTGNAYVNNVAANNFSHHVVSSNVQTHHHVVSSNVHVNRGVGAGVHAGGGRGVGVNINAQVGGGGGILGRVLGNRSVTRTTTTTRTVTRGR